MAYRLAPQAEADLEDIAFYIFLESGSQDKRQENGADRVGRCWNARMRLAPGKVVDGRVEVDAELPEGAKDLLAEMRNRE